MKVETKKLKNTRSNDDGEADGKNHKGEDNESHKKQFLSVLCQIQCYIDIME